MSTAPRLILHLAILSRAILFDTDLLHPDLVGQPILPLDLSIINGSRRLDRIRFLRYLHSLLSSYPIPEFWAALCLCWATLATYPLMLLLFLLLNLSLEERLMFSHEYNFWCGKSGLRLVTRIPLHQFAGAFKVWCLLGGVIARSLVPHTCLYLVEKEGRVAYGVVKDEGYEQWPNHLLFPATSDER